MRIRLENIRYFGHNICIFWNSYVPFHSHIEPSLLSGLKEINLINTFRSCFSYIHVVISHIFQMFPLSSVFFPAPNFLWNSLLSHSVLLATTTFESQAVLLNYDVCAKSFFIRFCHSELANLLSRTLRFLTSSSVNLLDSAYKICLTKSQILTLAGVAAKSATNIANLFVKA